MSHELDSKNINHGEQIAAIHSLVAEKLIAKSVEPSKITDGEIRSQSILYMIYWHHRLKNNPLEQARIDEHLVEYIGADIPNHKELATHLLENPELGEASTKYVEDLLVPTKTVDLVIIKSDSEEVKNKEVLCLEREYYPMGPSLPGGFIKDTDEDNVLGVTPEIFAALRVAGEKVLGLGSNAKYELATDSLGKKCYLVQGESSQPVIRLYPEDEGGYHYRENIKTILRPSDPRHIVDTVGFRCVLEGELPGKPNWKNRAEIMNPGNRAGGFAFGHHREIVAYIASLTSDEKARNLKERDFVRSLVNNPLEQYKGLAKRFAESGNDQETSMPELLPVLDRLMSELFKDEINLLCEKHPLLAGFRDRAANELRHVNLNNRTKCPYESTLRAITQSVAFFDVVALDKCGFFDDVAKDKIIEHDPSTKKFSKYHSIRYEYRYNQLMSMIPNELIIPTFESLSATDLLKVRSVPIRFIGISTDFLYVDEFEQSPDEFFKHDVNHSWRMAIEDLRAQLRYGRTDEELSTGEYDLTIEDIFDPTIFNRKRNLAMVNRMAMIEESNRFREAYLEKIKILKTDSEEVREMKKLKKIILFEVVHEDAKPFLKEIVTKSIQSVEGGDVPFEVPRIQERGWMDVVDILDTGISTLSYVRNKLQHGFYDQTDAQLPQIVDPRYRTSEWIAKAAYEMLVELEATIEPSAETDDTGHVSYEWLLKRTAAVGPDNIHDSTVEDPAVDEFGSGADKLNEKRYIAN